MASDQVALALCSVGTWASVRELCGHDESSIQGTTTVAAVALVDRVLVDAPGSGVRPGFAGRLSASDRDRILAAIYSRTYGRSVRSEVVCRSCNQRFDLDFVLTDLVRDLGPTRSETAEAPDSTGAFSLESGVRFRLPSGEDECAALGRQATDAEARLLASCLIDGDPARDGEDVENAMARIAPIVSADLDATCPECDSTQSVHFDLQDYLLGALLRDQRQLAEEVHALATSYGWGLTEILTLPRSQRHALVALVDRATPDRWR